MPVLLDLFRLFAGVAILAFASYTDWKWRRAPNVLWTILGAAGALALLAQVVLDPAAISTSWRNLAFVPAFALIVYALWWLGLIAGGADAKALMALGILLPFPVALDAVLPLMPNPLPAWPAAVTVLTNSLLLFLAVPLVTLLWNVAHGDLRLPHAILGVRRAGRLVRRGHYWPMEIVQEDGTRKTRYFPSRMDESEVDEVYARTQALGDDPVWVTPKVPFMIPLLGGFVAAFFFGDLLMAAMIAVIG